MYYIFYVFMEIVTFICNHLHWVSFVNMYFFGHMLKDGEVSGEEGGEGITDECAMLLTSERHSHVSTLQRVLKSHTSKCGTTCKC